MALLKSAIDDRQRVLDETDIVHLVGERLALKARGREYVCICPFHDDHKPSMCVVPHKQIYHCFSCGAGGNAFDFVMNYHKMTFRESLELLAQRAGIELTPWRKNDDGGGDDFDPDSPAFTRADIAQVNRAALDFFCAILKHEQHGATARDALTKRTIDEGLIESFQLGAAPDRWDGLLATLTQRGCSEDLLVAAGLAKHRDTGGAYDAFRNRIIFPIIDQAGRAIAFGARRIDDADEPKYLNSPETSLFDKSATLYGLHAAARPIQEDGRAVVTEGYTDVIACHAAGFTNVVATLGTALTPKHARVLRRLCDTVVILFDGDQAGARAADRALEVFFAEPVDVKIAILPDGADPDELLKSPEGSQRFREAIDGAVDALDYRFARLGERLSAMGLSARAAALRQDLIRLAEIGLNQVAPLRKQLIIRQIAALAGVSEQTVLDELRHAARPRRTLSESQPVSVVEPAEMLAPAEWSAAEHALGCLLCEPGLLGTFGAAARDVTIPGAYDWNPAREVARAFWELVDADDEPTLARLLAALENAQARQAATSLASEIERVTDHDTDRLREHLGGCLRTAARQRHAHRDDNLPAEDAPLIIETEHPTESLASRLASVSRRHRELEGNPAVLPRVSRSTGG